MLKKGMEVVVVVVMVVGNLIGSLVVVVVVVVDMVGSRVVVFVVGSKVVANAAVCWNRFLAVLEMALVVAATVDLCKGGNVGWVVGNLRLSEK